MKLVLLLQNKARSGRMKPENIQRFKSSAVKEGSSLKRGLLTTIIYFGVFNYILKTSYGGYVVKRWLFQ